MDDDRLLLRGLGVTLEVHCTGAAVDALVPAMARAWSRCRAAAGASTDPPVATLEVRLDDEAELPHRLMTATQEITKGLITAQIGTLLMLHAGAVSHPETGDSLVYVAPGGTGKTTLSRLLGQRYGYLTDEAVGITETGEILPYPKPLSVRRPEDAGLKDEVSPDALGLVETPTRARVRGIVLLDRRPDAGAATVREVDFMDALAALTEQSSSLTALPRPLHRLAALIDSAGPVWRFEYREAEQIESAAVPLIEGAR